MIVDESDAQPEVDLPYMPLWVYRILADRDCRLMPDVTFGRYMRLLIRQWVEGGVPALPAEAVKDAGLDPGSEGDVQSLLDRKFAIRDGDQRLNDVCRQERADAVALCLKNRESGRKGGRSRKEANGIANAQANAIPSAQANAQATRVSISPSESESLVLGEIPDSLDSATVREALLEWIAYRREKRKPFSKRAAAMSFRRWQEAGWTAERIVAAIRHSIACDYQGIFEPSQGGSRETPAERRRRQLQEMLK